MAGVVQVGADSSLAMEALYGKSKDRKNLVLASFERDLDFTLKLFLKKNIKTLNQETCLRL